MGNAAGQDAEALQFLGLLELLFKSLFFFLGLFALGDVLRHAPQADCRAIFINYPHAAYPHPSGTAIKRKCFQRNGIGDSGVSGVLQGC